MADVSSIYQQALSEQNTRYSQITAGYNQLLAAQMAGEAQVAAGYNTLSGTVQGAIQGVDASQRQAIQDTYAQQWGGQQQQLINSGLGNTTVRSAVNRGLVLDENKAEVALSNQMAQLKAGYLSQIGLAGLGYQGSAVQANSQLGAAGLQAQAAQAPVYASLYNSYGQAMLGEEQLAQQRQLAQQQMALQSGMQARGLASQGYAQQNALDAQRQMQDKQLGYQYAALNAVQQPFGAPSYVSQGSGGSLWNSAGPQGNYGGGGLAGSYGGGNFDPGMLTGGAVAGGYGGGE